MTDHTTETMRKLRALFNDNSSDHPKGKRTFEDRRTGKTVTVENKRR